MASRVEAPSPLPAAASHLHGPEAEVHRLVCWLLSRAGGQQPQGRASGKRPQTLEFCMPPPSHLTLPTRRAELSAPGCLRLWRFMWNDARV